MSLRIATETRPIRSSHERYHRQHGRSSSSSSSLSSSSDSSIGSVSLNDVRGLGLQDAIRGIAAVRLEHQQRKFALNTDGIGKKIDVKIAVKELKAGFKDMKWENGLGSRDWKG
jgi:hypothetical protein